MSSGRGMSRGIPPPDEDEEEDEDEDGLNATRLKKQLLNPGACKVAAVHTDVEQMEVDEEGDEQREGDEQGDPPSRMRMRKRMRMRMRRGMSNKWEKGNLNFRGDLWKWLDAASETEWY